MNLKFTPHVQKRLKERTISVGRLVMTMKKPDTTKAAFEGRTEVIKKFGKKKLHVIFFHETFRDKRDDCIIVTAYYEN